MIFHGTKPRYCQIFFRYRRKEKCVLRLVNCFSFKKNRTKNSSWLSFLFQYCPELWPGKQFKNNNIRGYLTEIQLLDTPTTF
jgi:hypothetical protein